MRKDQALIESSNLKVGWESLHTQSFQNSTLDLRTLMDDVKPLILSGVLIVIAFAFFRQRLYQKVGDTRVFQEHISYPLSRTRSQSSDLLDFFPAIEMPSNPW
jgi:hypothetical protein